MVEFPRAGPNKWGESPPTDPDSLTGGEWVGDDWDGLKEAGSILGVNIRAIF